MLLHRVLSAAIGIPLGIVVVWKGGVWLAFAVALLAVLGFQEYHAALRLRHVEALREIGFPAVLALAAGPYFLSGLDLLFFLQGVLVLVAVASLSFHIFAPVEGSKLASAAATVLGVVYIGFLFGFSVMVREMPGPAPAGALPFGLRLFLLVWLATMAADTGAYACGKAFGRRPLCPAISPGKTVEGAIGGLLGALLTAAAFGTWFQFALWHSLALGVLMAVVGLVGDLGKSVIKRDVGVKDFGSLIPGHGGVLDRFDSTLVNMPVAYFFAVAFMQ